MRSFLKNMCSFSRGICWTTSNKCCPFRTAVSVGQEVVGQHVFGKCVPGDLLETTSNFVPWVWNLLVATNMCLQDSMADLIFGQEFAGQHLANVFLGNFKLLDNILQILICSFRTAWQNCFLVRSLLDNF